MRREIDAARAALETLQVALRRLEATGAGAEQSAARASADTGEKLLAQLTTLEDTLIEGRARELLNRPTSTKEADRPRRVARTCFTDDVTRDGTPILRDETGRQMIGATEALRRDLLARRFETTGSPEPCRVVDVTVSP